MLRNTDAAGSIKWDLKREASKNYKLCEKKKKKSALFSPEILLPYCFHWVSREVIIIFFKFIMNPSFGHKLGH